METQLSGSLNRFMKMFPYFVSDFGLLLMKPAHLTFVQVKHEASEERDMLNPLFMLTVGSLLSLLSLVSRARIRHFLKSVVCECKGTRLKGTVSDLAKVKGTKLKSSF